MENFSPALIVSSFLLWFVALFNLLLTFALIKRSNAGNNKQNEDWLRIGSRAPGFRAPNLKDETVTLDSFDGKSILFVFLSPDCRSCGTLIPQLPEIELSIRKNNTELAIVSLADPQKTLGLITTYAITSPVIVAPRYANSFTQDYKVGATPFYCLVGKNKRIQEVGYFSPKWNTARSMWSFNLAEA